MAVDLARAAADVWEWEIIVFVSGSHRWRLALVPIAGVYSDRREVDGEHVVSYPETLRAVSHWVLHSRSLFVTLSHNGTEEIGTVGEREWRLLQQAMLRK